MHPKNIAFTKALPGFVYHHGNYLVAALDIPAGLRCRLFTDGSTAGSYFLEELPADLFPYRSLVRHDAMHYGIVLTPDQVTFEPPNPEPAETPSRKN